MASTTTIVTKISIEDIEKTYNGEQGCACGCGGDYMYTNETPATAAKHIAKINARLKSNSSDVENGGNYISIEGATRATRIYLKDGIRFNFKDGQIARTETIAE